MSNEIKGTVATVGNISGTLNAGSGFDGASAYEIAVKNGFEGTETEWLESLQGESGVYVGSGEMPEDCNVQIDPEGEVLSIEHTYSPTSENPQSGIAVADAISTLQTNNGTVVSQNADFAEVAEWADGNPNNEDRTGYFVCANVPVDGIVMKKATSIDDVKGVSILAPAFAGNYSKDKVDENGNLLPKYSYVAIIGFVPVIDNGTCEVGGRCMPDDNGCAIPSSNSMGYQVVNRLDENRVLIIIEPNGDMVQRVKTKITAINEELSHKANNIVNSASGESILLTDSSNYPLENLKVYGKSTQDGTPTPEAPIDIVSAGASGSVEVKVLGKNLAESVYVPKSTLAQYGMPFYIKANLKPNTTYTLSFKGTVGNKYYFNEKLFAYQTFTVVEGVNTFTLKTAENLNVSGQYNNTYGWIILKNNATQTQENTFEEVMLESGSIASPYEPYTEQTLTLATPNELRRVGEYADYIDLERGVFVQNIYRATEKDFTLTQWSSTGAITFYAMGSHVPTPNVENTFAVLCSIANKGYSGWEPISTATYRIASTGQKLVIILPKTYTTVEQAKPIKDAGFEFLYPMATPIETPLTAEEIAYYKALHTNYPNTTIFNTDGTNMDVSYVADTKLYIDNKFAELQALALGV